MAVASVGKDMLIGSCTKDESVIRLNYAEIWRGCFTPTAYNHQHVWRWSVLRRTWPLCAVRFAIGGYPPITKGLYCGSDNY